MKEQKGTKKDVQQKNQPKSRVKTEPNVKEINPGKQAPDRQRIDPKAKK